MSATLSEQALIDRFSRTYAGLTGSDTMLAIERAVCGCDYGCTGWTTRDEAEDVRKLLDLGPETRLLEIGSGSGWPGLYLAKESGCDIAMVDLPIEGLQAAKKRARVEGIEERCWITQAGGAALPFPSASFDAIYHSDVQCCLIRKQAVLEACRQVVREDGKMAFSVILITPGLSDEDFQRAASAGPAFIESSVSYPDMIERAGWRISSHTDKTKKYFETFRNMYTLELDNSDEIERVHGQEGAAELFTRRANTLDALERDLLRREAFMVVPDDADL